MDHLQGLTSARLKCLDLRKLLFIIFLICTSGLHAQAAASLFIDEDSIPGTSDTIPPASKKVNDSIPPTTDTLIQSADTLTILFPPLRIPSRRP